MSPSYLWCYGWKAKAVWKPRPTLHSMFVHISLVFFTPALCRSCVQGELKTCMSGQLVARPVGLLGTIPGVLNRKQGVQQGSQIVIRQHLTTARPQPALTHGQATMEGLLENEMACEKCRTETKRHEGDSHKNWSLIKCWPGGERGPSHLFAAHPEGVEAGVTCMPWKSAAFTLFTQEVINLHVCGQLHKLFLVMGPCARKGLRGFHNDL